MKRLRRQQWAGGALFVAGAGFLVSSLFIGTGWNIATAICIAFSGALTWSSARFARRAAEADSAASDQAAR